MFPFKSTSISKLFDRVPRSFSSIQSKSTEHTIKHSPQQNTYRSNRSAKAIKTFVRFRPLSMHEIEIENSFINLAFPNNQTVHINGNSYQFEKVFTQASSQTEVYGQTTSHLIDNFFEGYDSTLIAYGQTGSGKTFTMFGDHRKGIIPLAGQEIIRRLNASSRLYVSGLQIYNESIVDLLTSDKIKKLTPSLHEVKSTQQLSAMITKCHEMKKIRATLLNDTSSRSHVVFTMHLEQYVGNQITNSKFSLVDLAGNQRIDKSQPSNLTETKKINLSLSCLTKTIKALIKKQSYVPYRESKLTQVLQGSLGGCLSMIITCSSHSSCLNETLNSIRFGVESKRLQTVASKNITNAAQNTVQKVLYDSLKSELENYEEKMSRIREILETASQSKGENKYLKQIANILNYSELHEDKVFNNIKIPNFQLNEDSTQIQNYSTLQVKNTEIQKLEAEIEALKISIQKYKELLRSPKELKELKIEYLTFEKEVLLCQIEQLQIKQKSDMIPQIRSKDEYIAHLEKKVQILGSLMSKEESGRKKILKVKKLAIKN